MYNFPYLGSSPLRRRAIQCVPMRAKGAAHTMMESPYSLLKSLQMGLIIKGKHFSPVSAFSDLS
jgi:hypothetical protein